MLRRYQQWPAIAVLVLAIVLMVTPSVPPFIVFILLIASAVLFFISSRGSYYFSKAYKIFKAGNMARYEEGLGYIIKAVKAGLPDNYLVIAASVMMQYGDIEEARRILEPLVDSKDKQAAGLAKITLSMYYFACDDLDKAIELCESARDEDKSEDRNLFVNLSIYYLKSGKRKEFRKCVREAMTRFPSSPAVADMQAMMFMADERWDLAGGILQAMFETVTPSFADPYAHMAIVYLHYGEIGKARREMEKAAGAIFTNISMYRRDDIEAMKEALGTPDEAKECALAINASATAVAAGIRPEWQKGEMIDDLELLPGFPPEPDFRKAATPARDDVEGESGEVNTELTEADEKWLKRHED